MEMIRTSPSGCGARGEAATEAHSGDRSFCAAGMYGYVWARAEADIETCSFRFSGVRGALTGDHGQT